MNDNIKVILPDPRAIAYYRVSSDEQRKKKSIGAQRAYVDAFAKEKGYEIVKEFYDDGFEGGTIHKRPGFVEMLKYVEENQDQTLLITFIHRIGRFKELSERNRVVELFVERHFDVYAAGLFGDDDILYKHENEEDVEILRQELWQSRKENKQRGRMIAGGHKRVRLEGGFSGGKVAYGVRYVKEEKRFEPVPHEVETLNVIFSKIRDGWGTNRLRRFLNQDLDRYRLRPYRTTYRRENSERGIRIGDPKEHLWTNGTIQKIVGNDFYFTGIIEPKKSKMGAPSVDTNVRLFDKKTVENVRRQRSNRVYYKKGEDDKVESIDDYLVLGQARCAHCNWKLGLHTDRSGKSIRRFYVCRGRKQLSDCTFKPIRTTVFDDRVWKAFVAKFKDADEIQELILKNSYIIDTDIATLNTKMVTVETDLEKVDFERKNLLRQHQKGYIDDSELDKRMEGVIEKKAELEEEMTRCEKALNTREDVEQAVDQAVNYVQDQVDLIELLGRYPDDPDLIERVTERFDILDEVYLSQEKIKQLANRLKRLALQNFIDPDKGIMVHNKDKFTIYGVAGKIEKEIIQVNGFKHL